MLIRLNILVVNVMVLYFNVYTHLQSGKNLNFINSDCNVSDMLSKEDKSINRIFFPSYNLEVSSIIINLHWIVC